MPSALDSARKGPDGTTTNDYAMMVIRIDMKRFAWFLWLTTTTTTTTALVVKDYPKASDLQWFRRNFLVVMGYTPMILCRNSDASEGVCGGQQPLSASLRERLFDTRDQIDMAVQASSVQAFAQALDLANDPLLDASSLEVLLEGVCEGSRRTTTTTKIVVDAVQNMRKTLDKTKTRATTTASDGRKLPLATEDAMAVMNYGTTARSTIDSILDDSQ